MNRSKPQEMSLEHNLFRFLDLPFEIRETIYEYCLVSNRMLPLAILSDNADRLCRTALAPAILSTCRQVYEEAVVKLYALNTFYIDHLAAWTWDEVESTFKGPRRRICAECSYWSLWHDYNYDRDRPLELDSQFAVAWNPNIRLIRRLHVSVRPYSFSQWDDVRKAVGLMEEGCRPIYSCPHMILDQIPRCLSLQLLICYISKPALLDRCEVTFPARVALLAHNYGAHGDRWRVDVEAEMDFEVTRLCRLAQRVSKIVVVPNSDSTVTSGFTRSNHHSYRSQRPSLISSIIPAYILRSGNLSMLEKIEASTLRLRGTGQWDFVQENSPPSQIDYRRMESSP